MKTSLCVLFGLSIAWSTANARDVDAGPLSPETYHPNADGLGRLENDPSWIIDQVKNMAKQTYR